MVALLARFWYALPIAGLLVAVWFLREDNRVQAADLKAATEHVATLETANKGLSQAIDAVKAQRVDNDAIATAVAAKIANNSVREVNTRTIIEKAAANDPHVASWADTPVPDSVRQALRAP